MKYLNLIYSNYPIGEYENNHVNHYDTTTEYKVSNITDDILNSNKVKIFSYKIRESTTVSKWMDIFNRSEAANFEFYGKKLWAYNLYTKPSWETILQGRIKLNETIDEINNEGTVCIPQELKLLETDRQDTQNDKLNKLHFIFETNIFDIEEYPEKSRLFYLLEAVNNLVHLCEKFNPNSEPPFEFHSFRLRDDLLDHREEMTNMDYINMDTDIGGTVTLDFGTVGKDLNACYYTNDVELVKRKEVKQQEYIKPFMSFEWNTVTHSSEYEYQKYYEWCEQNEVSKYGYNYKEPRYNLGRVIIGDLIGKDFIDPMYVQDILVNYPYFADIILTSTPLTNITH